MASTHPTIRRSGLKVTQPRRWPLQYGFWAAPASSITPSYEGADALPQQQPCNSPKYYSVKVASSVWRAHDRCARRCTQDHTFTCWALACDRGLPSVRSLAPSCTTATDPVGLCSAGRLLSRRIFSKKNRSRQLDIRPTYTEFCYTQRACFCPKTLASMYTITVGEGAI